MSNLQECYNKPENMQVLPVVNKEFHNVDSLAFLVEIVNRCRALLVIFILKLIINSILN